MTPSQEVDQKENANIPAEIGQVAAGGVAILLLLSLSAAAFAVSGWRHGAIVAVGALAGLGLYHARFGFTGAWRRLVLERRGRGLRAQALLLGSTALVSFPLIAWGGAVGLPAGGFVFPFGVAAALGAFIFGIGMQFGGGCASGTLFTAGGGSTRMMVTLAAFVTGSVWATAHMSFWNGLPRLPALSLLQLFGVPLALVLTLGTLAVLVVGSIWLERRTHGTWERWAFARFPPGWWRGPWSMEAGALVLAVVSILTLLVLSRPWGITSGFALWGAKVLRGMGVEVETWSYWSGQVGALERSLIYDATSVMNFAVLLGAMLAAALAHNFRPVLRISGRDLATAIFGGLLMGYGARLAYGCNIGAYLGGVISGSLHGWLWLIFGFAGSTLGARIKQRWAL